jgi:hypothetical protein
MAIGMWFGYRRAPSAGECPRRQDVKDRRNPMGLRFLYAVRTAIR